MTTQRNLLVFIASLALLIVVCGGVLTAFVLSQQAPAPASLLILDAQSRLHLIGDDGQAEELVADASREAFRYPAIAPDGQQIAYVAQEARDAAVITLDLASGDRTELYRNQEDLPLYLTWSPDGQYLSFLSNQGGGGLGIHIVPADGSQEATLVSAARGSSYFAWSPDSTQLLLHLNGSAFTNGQMALHTIGETDDPALILDDPGFFQAPAWSIDGAQVFYVAQGPPSERMAQTPLDSKLMRVAPDGSDAQVLAREGRALLFFSRAPTSDLLAYTAATPSGPSIRLSDYGPLQLVDGTSGTREVVSRPDDTVVAFFWSPDGEQLAYLTADADPDTSGLPRYTWHVVASNGGDVRDLEEFVPSSAFAALLRYFDAYAMAYSPWSPDGQTLTYGTQEGVFTLDVASGDAERAADGVLSLWVTGE